MWLRPANAVWFEMLIARDDLASTMRCLADGADVELESRGEHSAARLLPCLRAALDEYRGLAQRYAHYWPNAPACAVRPHAELEALSATALERLRGWTRAAEPLIAQLQKLQYERGELAQLEHLLSQTRVPLPDLDLLYACGPVLASRVYVLESRTGVLTLPASVLVERVDCVDRSYLLVVGPRPCVETLDEGFVAQRARRLELPPAAAGASGESAPSRLEARLAEIGRLEHRLYDQLAACDAEHGLRAALTDLALIEWLAGALPEFTRTDHFVRIDGWARDRAARPVVARLQRAGIHHLLYFPVPPPELTPPIVLRNPRWAQPFELFARLLGTPGANEADPSVLLAVLAPLMFGFMFGDVGQGAVLVACGLALRKRYPAAELLVSGGIAAMAFGVLFGSVFAREDLLPALWLHPLQKPLRLLVVTLTGGAGVILLGLALDALEGFWSGQGARWWATRGGLVVSYLGAMACALDRRAAWLIPVGIVWYCLGEVSQSEHRAQRAGQSVAEAIQTLLQLLANTLSFVRVGAFALAHAGLAAAINALFGGIGSRTVSILGFALGNAVLILIEGLVVGIQTTRLVLFEFFVRFLRGAGRAFLPLPSFPTTMALSRKS